MSIDLIAAAATEVKSDFSALRNLVYLVTIVCGLITVSYKIFISPQLRIIHLTYLTKEEFLKKLKDNNINIKDNFYTHLVDQDDKITKIQDSVSQLIIETKVNSGIKNKNQSNN